MNRTHLDKRGGTDNRFEARIESLEMAFRMQAEAQGVFDELETQKTRDAYDGAICKWSWLLVDLSKVESGWCRFTTGTGSRGMIMAI